MSNELWLIVSFILFYGGLLVWYRLFGEHGLYAFTVFASIIANIEVLLMVRAFGMVMTLGNIMFATTFVATDILSENYGKKNADRAVMIGIAASLTFLFTSQLWLHFTPSSSDWARPAFDAIFSKTPRLILASLVVYAITQLGDVWMYHRWWDWTTNRFGDSRKFLWLRNNASTLAAQLVNSVLYTFLAFYGRYDMSTLWSIAISSYIIFIATSLLDTPIVYIARWMHERGLAE
jgi:uncharacterized integral membrane protein (TIGR00697 family)